MSSENSGSSEDRWDADILNEFECKNVWVDDEEERLPAFFDTEKVAKVKSQDCALCFESFNLFSRREHHCRSCGVSCCDLCSQTKRRLS